MNESVFGVWNEFVSMTDFTYNNMRSLFVLNVKETEKVLNVIALDDLYFQALSFNKNRLFL